MRTLPGNMADDLMGSSGGVSLIVNMWYGGEQVFGNVPIKQWQLQWDDTRAIMGQCTASILDFDSKMVPWGYDEALGVGGGLIQVKLVVNDSSVDLAYMPLSRSDPTENWTLRTVNGEKVWVPAGHVIAVQGDDMTLLAQNNKFLAPETPPSGATCFSELHRIMLGDVDVIIDTTLTDRSVPSTVVYKDDRMVTLQQLCDALNAEYRVTGTGQLYVYARPTVSQYTLKGDSHDAQLSAAEVPVRAQQKQGLYNGVISTNTIQNGTLLQGTAFETGGPLMWGGNHGKVPFAHNANFATTQAQIDADAASQLATLIRQRASVLTFRCRFDPRMETGDYITLMLPQADGTEYPLPATVSSITMGGNSGIDALMEVRVNVAYADMLEAAEVNKIRKLYI